MNQVPENRGHKHDNSDDGKLRRSTPCPVFWGIANLFEVSD
jgi:hypothetical protein